MTFNTERDMLLVWEFILRLYQLVDKLEQIPKLPKREWWRDIVKVY